LDAAVNAFAEKGFHGTTTRDIADAIGRSPAAIYVHHRSKEELLYLISKEGMSRLCHGYRRRNGKSRTPWPPFAG
jgi:AcrR family transcriptional regulator